jgi:uncharacterized protein (TIGR02466 family)
MPQPTVYAIFPIPIYTVECDIDVLEASLFLEKNHPLLPNSLSGDYGNKTIDDYILENSECQELKKFILYHIEKYADEVMAWDFKHFQVTQSWVTIKKPGEMHGIHYHPNSVVSAVFFFQDDLPNSEPLKFHRPAVISQLMNQFAPATSTEKMSNTEFPWHHWSMPPKKNTLVIFPSWLSHSVDANITTVPRKSLAINAIPTGKFGSSESAAEIDINRLI